MGLAIGNFNMLCEEVRQSLSAYIDDALTLPARVAMDEHLDRCPICRDEVVKLRSVTRGLGALSLPTPPADLIDSVSNAVMIEAFARRQTPRVSFGQRVSRFLEPRLFPYSVGWMASLILRSMFVALSPHFMPCVKRLIGYRCICDSGDRLRHYAASDFGELCCEPRPSPHSH